MEEEMIQFRYITDDERKRDKFRKLVASKNLSREDLVLILTSISLNYDIFPQGLLEKTLGIQKLRNTKEKPKKVNLKNITTKALIEELQSRKGIEKISLGQPYSPYELRKKYVPYRSSDGTRGLVTSGIVLLISPDVIND